MRPRHVGLLLGLAVAGSLAVAGGQAAAQEGGVPPPGAACRLGSAPMARTELVFGTDRGASPPVSDDEWSAFAEEEIAPRFPDGFTVLDGQGQWRGSRGVIRERSRLLILWHRPSPEDDARIEAVRQAYKTRFGQDSVARIDGADCVGF